MYNVHGLFPVHLSATQIHSQVQVHNKQMSSTGLVYAYVRVCVFVYFFAVALFCLLKVKFVHKWSEKSVIWYSPVFRSSSLSGSGLDDLLTWWIPVLNVVKSECVSVSCHCGEPIALSYIWLWTITCLGSPTDVLYWEKVLAGFPNCAFAMHGIQVSWKVGFVVCSNLGSFKKGAVKRSTMPPMGQRSKMPNSSLSYNNL